MPAPLQLLQQAFLVPGDRLLQLPAWQPVLLWGWPLEQPLLAERRPVRKPELLPAATIAAALAAEPGSEVFLNPTLPTQASKLRNECKPCNKGLQLLCKLCQVVGKAGSALLVEVTDVEHCSETEGTCRSTIIKSLLMGHATRQQPVTANRISTTLTEKMMEGKPAFFRERWSHKG